jgi:hypothetical protein
MKMERNIVGKKVEVEKEEEEIPVGNLLMNLQLIILRDYSNWPTSIQQVPIRMPSDDEKKFSDFGEKFLRFGSIF